MKIKEINDIYKINIICTDNDEVMECKDILDKLGLKTRNFDNKKENIIVRLLEDGIFFSNCSVMYISFDNISFFDFKQQTKSIIPVVQDIEYNKEDGRIIKINNCKGQSFFIVSVGESFLSNGLSKTSYLVKFIEKNIELGKVYINKEMCKKAENKLIIEAKLRNIATRLNKGVKIDWDNFGQPKYYIKYDFEEKQIKNDCISYFKNQGVIYCLSHMFLDEVKKEISENELIKYFKE